MKAIFDTKPGSIYDDDLTRHYQFPRRYLSLIQKTEGDWIVLRRPRADGGSLAYFATARVIGVETDPDNSSLSFARFSDYLEFDRTVPWRKDGRYAEQALRDMPIKEVGIYLRGRSVRALAEADFADIVAYGLDTTLRPANARRLCLDPAYVQEIQNSLQYAPAVERERKITEVLMNRVFRDANFRRSVVEAYNDTCAVTGLRIIDEGGRSEVQAAHIWPVASGGPDVVQNGLALSGTVHWLFDRHLISLTDDYRLLISHEKVPPEFRQLFAHSGDRIRLPKSPEHWPHPAYIAKHRERFMATCID